jgi:hypothetical protein
VPLAKGYVNWNNGRALAEDDDEALRFIFNEALRFIFNEAVRFIFDEALAEDDNGALRFIFELCAASPSSRPETDPGRVFLK